jgi:predicted alpha/beta superfamily hydrolase
MQRTIKYFSGFDQPEFSYRAGAGPFYKLPMRRVQPGRVTGEWLWQVDLEAPEETKLQFFFGDQSGRDPKQRYYESAWALTYVCDGSVYNYQPRPSGMRVAPSETAYDPSSLPTFYSRQLNRNVSYRVYLPRGYRQHFARRYPVLYMLDGQNIFENSGFGSWKAKESLDRLIKRGQVAELIVVAIDSCCSRNQDYVPPEDGGQADRFATFLANEFKPHIDQAFRTKPQREHTGLLGSSLGGVMSLYAGWKYFHKFGKVGSMSGSWWLKGFRDSLPTDKKRPLTVYLDSGDSGMANDCVHHTNRVRGILENLGFELGQDLHHAVGRFHEHNERAWSRRLPHALRFLFPAA